MPRGMLLHIPGISGIDQRWIFIGRRRRAGVPEYCGRGIGEIRILLNLNYLNQRTLSPKAHELIQFDIESIRQIVSAQHSAVPETWLVDPDQYEKDGRLLRDSPAPRLIAYSSDTHIVYTTDGCNACARQVLSLQDIRGLPDNSGIPRELLERLASLVHKD